MYKPCVGSGHLGAWHGTASQSTCRGVSSCRGSARLAAGQWYSHSGEILQAGACRSLSVCTCNELSPSSSAELKDKRVLA